MKRKVLAAMLAATLLLTGMVGVAAENTEDRTMTTRAQSPLTSMELSGYMDEMVNGNIGNWALTALEKNPNIIEEIEKATASGVSLGTMLGDAFSQIGGGLFTIGVAEGKGYQGKNALSVTSNKLGAFNDIDYKISQLPNTRLDWRGAKEAWIYVDASGYGNQTVLMGFGIQEKNTDASGNVLPNNYESWGIRNGAKVQIYDVNKGSWQEVTAKNSTYTQWNPGRMPLPAGFKGWIAIPLNTATMQRYWTNNTPSNDKIDLADVNQFQICVEGNDSTIGKTFYMGTFGIVGEGFGGALPVSGRMSGSTFIETVPIDDVLDFGNVYTGTIVAWYSEFPGKLLTGLAYNYLISPTAELKAAGDRLADALMKAQAEDGYMGAWKGNDILGGFGRNWDVWGHYHSIYGLLYWYRVSGDADALKTAKKGADKIYDYFIGSGRTFDSAGNQTMNLGISHAFAELYKETGNENYLKAAVQIVEEEWPRSGNWLNATLDGKEYYQTALPRWEALHTVMTLGTLWELTGTEKYYTALENIWWSIAKTDRHNTGGFSSGEAACGDPYNTGAIETCCTVAWMALSTEYLQLSRNSIVADELELSYYNAMLGSLLDGERQVTYNTPMEGGVRVPSQTDIAFQYNSGSPDFNCCQANVSRGLGELSQWALLTDDTTMYVNFYGETEMAVKTPGGQSVMVKQETAYPLDGAVKITLSGLVKAESFKLALRMPSWANASYVTVDGRKATVTGGKYYTVDREWKNGDTVTLDIGMTVHTWVHEKKTDVASLYYGPILLAAETKVTDVTFEQASALNVEAAKDGKHWLTATLTAEGKEYTLYDFASIGKFTKYATWMAVSGLPDKVSAVKGEAPIWANKIDDGITDSEPTDDPTTPPSGDGEGGGDGEGDGSTNTTTSSTTASTTTSTEAAGGSSTTQGSGTTAPTGEASDSVDTGDVGTVLPAMVLLCGLMAVLMLLVPKKKA